MPEIKILTDQRVVTAAGTAEKIKEAPEYVDAKVIAIHLTAHLTNTGNLYIANEDNRAAAAILANGHILAPGDVWDIDVSQFADGWIDLSKIYVDAAVSGEGFSYTAFKVIE